MRELEVSKMGQDEKEKERAIKPENGALAQKCNKILMGTNKYSEEMIDLMKSMLNFNPYMRMTAFECI